MNEMSSRICVQSPLRLWSNSGTVFCCVFNYLSTEFLVGMEESDHFPACSVLEVQFGGQHVNNVGDVTASSDLFSIVF